VHTGEPLLTADGYIGVDVHRAARIAAAAHGGQIVLSQSTRDLVPRVPFVDLGEHRLKDLTRAERLFQLGDDAFPPLRSLHRTNLPVAAMPLIGRAAELTEILARVRDGQQLLTFTGTGGTGKTRLAVQAGAELIDDFPDGVFFVGLAAVRDVESVMGTVAQAMGMRPDDDPKARLEVGRHLLVLDNAEHLPGVHGAVSELLGCGAVLIVTSRAPLHLTVEHEIAVEPLGRDAAVELFVSRAEAVGRRLVPDESVAELCRRLDNLPLAIELAAARTKVITPAGLLGRLEGVLPLLAGGAADAPERQRTLRATIAWSHELLDVPEREAFRRLSVFRGTCSLDAAADVALVDFELATSLVDKSLLKPVGKEMLLMLETLREFAGEQLDDAGETDIYKLRHAEYYLEALRKIEPELRGPRTGDYLAWFLEEEDNLRAMLDWFSEGDAESGAEAATLLAPYWTAHGRLREGRSRLRTLASADALSRRVRARLLCALGDIEHRLGESTHAIAASREAVELAREEQDHRTEVDALITLCWIDHYANRHEQAVAGGRAALEAARSSGSERAVARASGQLGLFMIDAGLADEAEAMLRFAIDRFRSIGDRVNEAIEMSNLSALEFARQNYDDALGLSRRSVSILREFNHLSTLDAALDGVAANLLATGNAAQARKTWVEALEIAESLGRIREVLVCLRGIALASLDDPHPAARLQGAVASICATQGVDLPDTDHPWFIERQQTLVATTGIEEYETEARRGGLLSVVDAIELARSLSARDGN
jgi:predicted ATPase